MFLFQSPSIFPFKHHYHLLFFIHPLYPITRRPVDFFKIGVNRVLMDLIGVRFPINCQEVRFLFCYDVEYLRKSWA